MEITVIFNGVKFKTVSRKFDKVEDFLKELADSGFILTYYAGEDSKAKVGGSVADPSIEIKNLKPKIIK